MHNTNESRWRTYRHPAKNAGNYGCCQIIDSRTQVIHLIELGSHHFHRARLESAQVDEKSISQSLWPTAPDQSREALPQKLAHYLVGLRGEDMPEPRRDRQMFSFSVYADGSHSWPAITLMTQDSFTPTPA